MSNKNSFHSKRYDGFVYVVRDCYGNIKVGSAHDVQKRMMTLRREYKEVKLLAVVKAHRFMFLEKFLHYALKDYHVKNEWFYCEHEEMILEKISMFIMKHGIIFGASEFEIAK